MKILWVGPSRTTCGVAGTTTLWLHGLSQVPGVDLRWGTNETPPERWCVPFDPLVEAHKKYFLFRRADLTVANPHCRLFMCDLNESQLEEALKGFGPGDLVCIDYSASVILPLTARKILDAATAKGSRTAVRIHSQQLQWLPADAADFWFGPLKYEEMADFDDRSPGGHIQEVAKAKYVVAPHPTGVPTDVIEVGAYSLGMGRDERMPHRYVKDYLVEEVPYETWKPGVDPWMPITEITRLAAQASEVILWYNDIYGVGQSSILGLAVASKRPVICSTSNFLSDADYWDGRYASPDDVPRGPLQVSEKQLEYLERFNPKASALRLLSSIGYSL